MSEIRKSLDENFKDKGNNEDQLIPSSNANYGQYIDSNQHNNIQEPFINSENIQINLNQNEISEPYQSQNNIEDNTNQQNKFSISPPFTNNTNNENNQQIIEINKNRNDNFQNNQVTNNYNNAYHNYQMNNYQPNFPPNNSLQAQQSKRPCCGSFECIAVFVGCVCGFISILFLPYLLFAFRF